jgi:thiosulfate dehydrogenase [quinone] large subunit
MESSHIFSLESAVGRREFLKQTGLVLTGITLAGTLGQILESCSSLTSPSANITHGTTMIDVSELTSNGQFLVDSSVSPDGTPIPVIRQNATTYTALSMLCTHQGCQVNSPSGGSIFCSCHGSRFNLYGQVVNGPAPTALTSYAVTLNSSANMITVKY